MHGSRSATTKSCQIQRRAVSRVSPSLAQPADRIGGFSMSGIAGLIRFDARPVMRRDLERTANALTQYGPDRVDLLAKENIGLVHALMRMTPEDRFDRQPHQGAS